MNYEKIATITHSIDNAIRDNVALKSAIVDTSSLLLDDASDETRQSIQDFLDAPLGDKKEIATKKAFAAAAVLAQEQGLLPTLPETAESIAAVVDDALTRVKTVYQVGMGILDPETAIDNIIDHATARATAYVDYAFDSGAVRTIAAEGIIKLTYCIPKIGPIVAPIVECNRPIIENTIKMVEEPAREIIKTGIHSVSSTAKNIAHTAIKEVKSFVKNFSRNIVSLFS